MAGQTWGPPGLANLALTLRTAAVMVLFLRGGKNRPARMESSREQRNCWGVREERNWSRRMLGCEQETGTRYSSRRRSVPCPGPGPGAVQVRSRPGGLVAQVDGTDASSIAVSGNTSAAAANGAAAVSSLSLCASSPLLSAPDVRIRLGRGRPLPVQPVLPPWQLGLGAKIIGPPCEIVMLPNPPAIQGLSVLLVFEATR